MAKKIVTMWMDIELLKIIDLEAKKAHRTRTNYIENEFYKLLKPKENE
jgi:hypothetical protein